VSSSCKRRPCFHSKGDISRACEQYALLIGDGAGGGGVDQDEVHDCVIAA
jgi:hypothetical protein